MLYLRKHEQYWGVTRLVPSDSDLLVHNLGHRRIAFFRDLWKNEIFRIAFKSFVPEKILRNIDLQYPEKALHPAYERQLSLHLTFSQTILNSSGPFPQTAAYLEFQHQFTPVELSDLWEDDRGNFRLSALWMQELLNLSSTGRRLSLFANQDCWSARR